MTIEELKQFPRVGSYQTATRCTGIQVSLTGADTEPDCNALLVTSCALKKWIKHFNHCGVDGLIVKKWTGRMAITKKILERLGQVIDVIDNPKLTRITTDIETLFCQTL